MVTVPLYSVPLYSDYNAGNLGQGIPDIHYHRYEYDARFPLGREVEAHVAGEFPQ